jgi:hypothetical protein
MGVKKRGMMKKGLLVVIFFLIASLVFSFDDNETRKSLKGLNSISVMIFVDGFEDLTDTTIRTDVELKLRMAGIKVIDEDDTKLISDAILYVEVIGYKLPDHPMYSFGIQVQVRQYGTFKRFLGNEELILGVETWSVNTVGYAGEDKMDYIRDGVKEFIDQFLNAYLSVNPK